MAQRKLTLYFTNRNQDSKFQLHFNLLQNRFVDKWIPLLQKAIDEQAKIKDQGVYYGSGMYDASELREDIVRAIQNINAILPVGIEHIVLTVPQAKDIDQKFLDVAHKEFERVAVQDPFVSGDMVQHRPLISKLNEAIHKFESTFGKSNNCFTLDVNFLVDRDVFLDDEDYEFFTPHRKRGELYLNYATIGVPIMDAFKHNEIERPTVQQKYRADFTVRMDPTVNFNKWDELGAWLRTHFNWDINDRKLAIGYISLGQLEPNGLSDEQLFQAVHKHKVLEQVLLS